MGHLLCSAALIVLFGGSFIYLFQKRRAPIWVCYFGCSAADVWVGGMAEGLLGGPSRRTFGARRAVNPLGDDGLLSSEERDVVDAWLRSRLVWCLI